MRDLSGNKYGKYTVLSLDGVKRYPGQTKAYWLCKCECGKEKSVRGEHLTSGRTKSCGCMAKNNALKHGHSKSAIGKPTYQAWLNLHARLRSKEPHKVKSYSDIGVDERWADYEVFLADMGYKPSPEHSLDRINPFLPYCADNCRWATRSEQMLNTRRHYK